MTAVQKAPHHISTHGHLNRRNQTRTAPQRGNLQEKDQSFFTLSEEKDRIRNIETAAVELQHFLREYGGLLNDSDFESEQNFKIWLIKNGLSVKFATIWKTKVLVDTTYGNQSIK